MITFKTKPIRMANRKKYGIRALINDIHLWLGLGSGIIIFLVCLSGTLLTFEKEIEGLFTQKLEVTVLEEKQTLETMAATLAAATKGHVSGVTLPVKKDQPYEFHVKKDLKERRGTPYLMDPYTQRILEPQKTAADDFMLTMFKLHRWLLMDISIGRPIVGVATIIFLIMSLSGLVLWFPKKVRWNTLKKGFKIKTTANWKRINHDLHNTLGFYSCIFIIIMGITGLCWSFEGYREGLGQLLGTPVFGNRGSSPSQVDYRPNLQEVTYDEVIETAHRELDYPGELSVAFPNENNPVFGIRKYKEAGWSPVAPDVLTIDQQGNLLQKELFHSKPWNEKFASLIKPIHTGEIFGNFSKVLYFLACLIGTSLPVTGTLIWWNKLKRKKSKDKSPRIGQVA